MNILCIGNSFSEDATRYLNPIANETLYVRNLYIGGCSLEMHVNNIKEEKEDYVYQKNGHELRMISINEAITKKKWDYVSIQQVSHLSGMSETYEPYMEFLINYIKEKCPDAKIVLHRTWAYENTSTHPGFANYQNDRKIMHEKIVETTSYFAKKYNLEIIPCGDAVEKAKHLPEFDIENGGISIHRDAFHLSYDYGRYLAGLVMYKFFTKKSPLDVSYEPKDTKHEVCEKLKQIASLTFS